MAFGSKSSTPSFVLTLPMDIGLNEQETLWTRTQKAAPVSWSACSSL